MITKLMTSMTARLPSETWPRFSYKMKTQELQDIAKKVRVDLIEMIYKAGSGHPAGSLSAVEILVALYFEILNDGDVFYLSNGHVCPAWYSVLIEKGLLSRDLIGEYTRLGSPLQGHPEKKWLSLVQNTSGPLGLGLAQAVGYAKALKMDVKKDYVYAMVSDAEHEEGNHWEAVLLASQFGLDNLIVFVDRNRIQIETVTDQIAPIGRLADKYRVFGWDTFEINGHNFEEIIESIKNAKEHKSQPIVIVANTTAGKGISFMEGSPDWHAKAPDDDQYKQAMEELLK